MLLWLLTSLIRPFNNAHIVTYTKRLVLWATNKLKHLTCWWKVVFSGDGFEAYPQELFARVTANLSSEHKIVSACWRLLQQWVDGRLFILLWTECCSNCQHDTTAYGMYSELFYFIYFIYLFIMFVVVMFFRCECLFKIAEFWFHKN